MSNIDNINLDYLKRKQNINNPYKEIDRSIKSYINRPINNKSEYEIPLSMMSNYNFPLKSELSSKYFDQTNDPRFTSISNNNVNSKDLYINYLKNRLNYFYKSNTELNNKYKYIANKSKLLIDNISNNKKIFNNLKKNYENSIKNNLDLKQKYNNLLEQYKRQVKYGDNNKNKDQNEIYNLQKEQNMLLSTVKSKEEIIDNLKKTLSIIKNEVEENKSDTENDNDNKKHKINVLKKVLNDLTFKIDDNKKNISILNGKINELNNEKYLLNDNNQNKFHNIDEFNNKNEHIYLKDEEYKNISKNKINILIPKIDLDKNNNFNYNNKLSSKLKKISSNNNNDEMNLEHSFGNKEVKGIPSGNLNSNSVTLDHYNYFNKSNEDDNVLNKKNQSVELEDKNKLILNKSNDNSQMNDKNVFSHTLDVEDIKNQQLTNLKNENDINKTKNVKRNLSNQFHNSSYLFTITKEGTFIEFDILEKIYTINDTSQIKAWNPFISEYLNNFEGSLLLNTFQGLFICTGKFYNDLYYYSKKFNSISKLKIFKHNHKYGALMLSSDNDTLLLIGGETNNIETLNFENGSIGTIPPLLKKRINSSYAFVGNILFAFFGKNNNTIEYLDMNNCQKWEIFDYKINIDNENENENENDIDKNINLDGHAAIPLIGDEVLIIGGNQNNKMIIFNYNEKSIEIADIDIPLIDNVGEYRFDKDKYFNVYIGTEKSETDGNSLNQLIGMDLMGNIHYFDNNLDYSVVLFNNEKP